MKRVGIKPLVTKRESVEQKRATLNGSDVRIASKEDFEKAQKKTNKLHAGLFRRLAK